MQTRSVKLLLCLFLLTAATAQGQKKIWGTSRWGGTTGAGNIFSIETTGQNFTVQKNFITTVPGFSNKALELVEYNGLLYGMTISGGVYNLGVLYSWNPVTNVYTKLYDFSASQGSNPRGKLTLYNNLLYGMTNTGGVNNKGVIFEFNPANNAYTKKVDLADATGTSPISGGLTIVNGVFYGMTSLGGLNSRGVLFSWNPSTNIYAKLYDFTTTTGGNGFGDLTYFNSKLYGLTEIGGTSNLGVIFEFDPATNTFLKKIDLIGPNGKNPQGSFSIFNNKLYATTLRGSPTTDNVGNIIEYDPATNVVTPKVTMVFNTGAALYGNLKLYNGKFFGLTQVGGASSFGALYEWDPVTNIYTYRYGFTLASGANPQGTLAIFNNKLYGGTPVVGKNQFGTLFEYDPQTTVFTKKIDFGESTDGTGTNSQLAYYNGKYYGVAQYSGANGEGTIFEFNPSTGQFQVKVNFPQAGLSQPFNGLYLFNNKFYGFAAVTSSSSWGGLFEWDPATNAFTKKMDFSSTNGYTASGRMVLISNRFYGTMRNGGTNSGGVIFDYDPVTNAYTKRYDFLSSENPMGFAYYNGKFYGCNQGGGLNSRGTIYEWNPATNAYLKRYDFVLTTGGNPLCEPTFYNNKLYGLNSFGGANNVGTLFEWDPATSVYTKKVDFNTANGAFPQQSFLEPYNGLLYGVAPQGGANNAGVLFSFNPSSNIYQVVRDFDHTGGSSPNAIIVEPDIPPVIQSFSPASAAPGTSITISGLNFSSISTENLVYFGPVRAAVTAASSNSLTVTVPTGAAYQPITVTTRNLTAYSSRSFKPVMNAVYASFTDRSFSTKKETPVDGSPTSSVTADLDGDGKADVITVNNAFNTLSIHRNTSNTGAIGFATKQTLNTANGPFNVSTGDVDGDGKLDLVVTNLSGSTISVFRNQSVIGNISFATRADYTVGSAPYLALVQDIDADGKPDMVVTNRNSNTVSILKNQSSPGVLSFQARIDFATGLMPSGMAIGDIDGDNNPDLVVGNYNSATLSVLRNTSSPGFISFAAKVDFTTGTFPYSIAIGDMNDDGKSDIAVANYYHTPLIVSVLQNASTPGAVSLAPKVDYVPSGFGVRSVALSDFNGDGKIDMVVGSSASDKISVFKNISSGGNILFDPKSDYTVGLNPYTVSATDMDNDGKTDIVSSSFGGNNVSVVRNRFGEPTITSFSPVNAAPGATITITGTNLSGTTSVSIGGIPVTGFTVLSSTQITATVPGIVSGAVQVTSPLGSDSQQGFFNGHSITGISPASGAPGSAVTISGINFSSNPSDNVVYFGAVKAAVVSASATSLVVTVPTGATYHQVTVARSGLVAYSPQFFVPTYAGKNADFTAGNFSVNTDLTTGANPVVISIGDFDGDGKPDLANNNWGSTTGTTFSVHKNQSTPGMFQFGAKADHTTLQGPWSVAHGDFDGDGKLDLVVTAETDSYISVYKNLGNGNISFAAKIDFATTSTPEIVLVTDINGDSRADIIVSNIGGSSVMVFRNTSQNGSISFDAPIDLATPSNAQSISIGDLDGDGKVDIVSANYNANSASIFRNTSTAQTFSFDARIDLTTGTRPWSSAIGDLNGDGKPEIIISSSNGSLISVFRNLSTSGTISFDAKQDYVTGASPLSVTVADINGDGKLDVLTGNNSGSVSLFNNISSGGNVALRPKFDLALATGSYGVSVADLDGDGKPDIAASLMNNAKISLFRNQSKLGQDIVFDSVPAKTYGDAPFIIHAQSSANLTLTYSIVSGPALLKTDTLNYTSAGTIIVKASNPGDATYYSGEAYDTIVIKKAAQTIIMDSIPDQLYTGVQVFINPTSPSGLYVYTDIDSGYASIGSYTYRNIRFNGAGPVYGRAYIPATTNYLAATKAFSFCVIPPKPVVKSLDQACINTTVTYAIDTVSGVTYHWSISGGGNLLNTIGSSAQVQWNTLGAHTITVIPSTNCGSYADMAVTKNITVVGPLAPGAPANLYPANNTLVKAFPMNLSWQPSANTFVYDVYVWEDGTAVPVEPMKKDIVGIGVAINQGDFALLKPGTRYNWKVVARNACLQTSSAVQYFRTSDFPNLIVQNVSVPTSAFSGETIAVTYEVKNIGKAGTGNITWFDYVFFSADSMLNKSIDEYVGARQNLISLDSGQSYTNTVLIKLPDGITGNFHVIVEADGSTQGGPGGISNGIGGKITESNELNNAGFDSLFINLTPPPDLRVTSVVTPQEAFSAQKINVHYTVRNSGTGVTRESAWKDRIYLSAEPVFDESTSIRLAEKIHQGALQPTQTYSFDTLIKLPTRFFGKHYIYVVTDVDNQVYEFAFNNNNSGRNDSINIFLTPPPDFVVTDVSGPSVVSKGQTITLNWHVKNKGANKPLEENTFWYDGIYLTKDSVLNMRTAFRMSNARPTEKICITQDNFTYCYDGPPVMNPGQSYALSSTFTLPTIANDSIWYLYVVADYEDAIFEYLNEGNNVFRKKITVLSPDLVVQSVNIPDTISSGTYPPVNWQVKNQGAGAVLNFNRNDRVYLSADSILQTDIDKVIYEPNYSTPIGAGEAIGRQESIYIHDSVTGSFYLFVYTDSHNEIFEKNGEGNNITRSNKFQVNLSPWVDLRPAALRINKDTVVSEEKIIVQYKLHNSGLKNLAGKGWMDKLYLSKAGIYNETAREVKSIGHSIAILSGDSILVVDSFSVGMQQMRDMQIDGNNCYFYLKADVNNSIYEHTDEGNNITSLGPVWVKRAPRTDLVMTSAQMPDSLLGGQSKTVSWNVVNVGGKTGYYYDYWYDGVYLSTDSVWDANDVFITDNVQYGPLGNNQGYSSSLSFVTPNGLSGNYYLIVKADHKNYHRDAHPADNYKYKAVYITMPPPPDLVITYIEKPDVAYSGQPMLLKYIVQNQGVGATLKPFSNGTYISFDPALTVSTPLLSSFSHNQLLQPGESYTDSVFVDIPLSAEGNYYFFLKLDKNNTVYEYTGEGNNINVSSLFIIQPPPADLVVRDLSVPSSIRSGDTATVTWTLRNESVNPVEGILREGVFLSKDTVWDAGDLFVSDGPVTVAIPPFGEEAHSRKIKFPGAADGTYFLLVRTDMVNNILETDETNNTGYSQPFNITVKELPINVLTPDTLSNAQELYYRITVPDSLVGETIRVSLTGMAGSANELYVKHGSMPTFNNFDFNYDKPLSPNQSITIPVADSGRYYVLVTGTVPALQKQNIHLLVKKINFEITNVTANKGGNTGTVTVKMTGAKYTQGMTAVLRNAVGTITASKIKLLNSTSLYATFDLSGRPVGIYDVQLQKPGIDTAVLGGGFRIVTGSGSIFTGIGSGGGGGGGGGAPAGFFCNIQNVGVEELLGIDVEHPGSTRTRRTFPMTINFGNSGDVDIPTPTRVVVSVDGHPISLTADGISEGKTTLFIELKEANGPDDVLRPGATGSIVIYTQSLNTRFIMRYKLVH